MRVDCNTPKANRVGLKTREQKMESKQNSPARKFSAGGIQATIWKNTGRSKTGSELDFFSVQLERRYKDKSDQWQSTNSFGVNDLPKAQLLLGKAYEFLTVKDE